MAQVDMFREVHSITKPPILNNFIFTHWKARMKAFIMDNDMKGWIMICKRLNVPTNEEAWNENDLRLIQANFKAMNMLYCAMNDEDFKNISKCSMAEEIWEKREQIYGERRKEEEIEETSLKWKSILK